MSKKTTTTTSSTRKPEKASLRPPENAQELLAKAEQILADVDQAPIFATDKEKRQYPTFEASEVQVGDILGVGGFGVVSEVSSLSLAEQAGALVLNNNNKTNNHPAEDDPDNDDEHHHYDIQTAKEKMVQRCIRHNQARYAIKKLDPALSEMDRTRGMIDMALEVKYLTVLWHPNIVKMRGICSCGSGDNNMVRADAFFIMDRLYETLEERIQLWAKQKKDTSSMFGLKKDKLARQHILVERLIVAYDLAVAFAYMHHNKLVYRDIKQENFGFDIRGDIKVFDFGLTKALLPSLKDKKSKMYNLTPITGSLPYMAPEVAMKVPYDCRCDCFSFAFLLYELLALKNTPYHGYVPREYFQRVVKSHERPFVRRTWPLMCQELLKKAWDYDPQKRPQMQNIAKMIREDLNQLSQQEDVVNRTKHMVERSMRSMNFTVEATNGA